MTNYQLFKLLKRNIRIEYYFQNFNLDYDSYIKIKKLLYNKKKYVMVNFFNKNLFRMLENSRTSLLKSTILFIYNL